MGRSVSWLRYLIARLRCWRQEWGCGWSIATSHACDLSGGHRWGSVAYDETMQRRGRECSRCGTWESVRETIGTGTLPIYPDATVTTAGFDTGQGGRR